MRIKQLITSSLIFLHVSLTACSLSGSQVPSDHFYRLPDAVATRSSQQLFDKILIRPVQVEGLYHERSLLYVEDHAPLEIKRYHYHYWVETPARLVQKHMQRYLQTSDIAGDVTLNPSYDVADIEITPVITGFERVIQNGTIRSHVEIDCHVQYAAGAGKSWSRVYTATIVASDATIHSSARAFGQALDQIMTTLLKDLSAK